jgi:hypothetical protein
MSILPSAIRPGAEGIFPRKQCGQIVWGFDRLGHARVAEAIYARRVTFPIATFEWINPINRFLSEKWPYENYLP